jgi:hypothetical protein
MKKKRTKYTNTRAKKITKVLVTLIPIIIISYILIYQYIIPKEFNYFYDIGSKKDINYLTTEDRVTDKIVKDANYREAIESLVYFGVDPPRGFTDVKVQARIKDNFPENTQLFIGVRDKEDWHYNYNVVFDSKEDRVSDWIIIETTFNAKENNITLINKGQLSLLINAPHLGKNETKNYTIPIDWINITVYKPGLLK